MGVASHHPVGTPGSSGPSLAWAQPHLPPRPGAPWAHGGMGTWRAGPGRSPSVHPEHARCRSHVTQAPTQSQMHRHRRQPHRDTNTLRHTLRHRHPGSSVPPHPTPTPLQGPKGTSRQKREGAGLGNLDQSQRPVWTRVSRRNCRGRPRGPDPLTLPEKNEQGSPPSVLGRPQRVRARGCGFACACVCTRVWTCVCTRGCACTQVWVCVACVCTRGRACVCACVCVKGSLTR